MSQLEVADNTVTAYAERALSAYVPPLQRTEGQPPPIAAHGGLSYMAFGVGEILLFCRSSARHTVRPAGRFPLAGEAALARDAHMEKTKCSATS
ncbi:MAG TPA: hypothetical protein VNY53_01465 [Bradyrhizobium sp.]|nr:hypothetical protein [Bradyrhizobium sp.]